MGRVMNNINTGIVNGLHAFSSLAVIMVAIMMNMMLMEHSYAGVSQHAEKYPRILNMSIGNTYYNKGAYQSELAKADIVILGFFPEWEVSRGMRMQDAVRAIKKLNPAILVGQYSMLMEEHDIGDNDKAIKIGAEGWWLRNENGQKLQWTSVYGTWGVNITSWTKADIAGQRYPEWLATRDFDVYFRDVPDFDIWYTDGASSKPEFKSADWDLDGKNDSASDPVIAKAYRDAHVKYWAVAKNHNPHVFLMGNSDDLSSPEYSGKTQAVYLEGVIGKPYATEKLRGWDKMMERYLASYKHTSEPNIVGFNVWGKKNDYQRMRYGLASCLLADGYYSYTDEDVGYSSVVWFDEYDADLGAPLEPTPTAPLLDGVYGRAFENGVVLVNPSNETKVFKVKEGYKYILGKQAPDVNTGQIADTISLNSKDGIILVRANR